MSDFLLCDLAAKTFPSAFHHCDQIPYKNNLEEQKFILALDFRGLSTWSANSMALGPSDAEHHGRRMWLRKVAQDMEIRKQRAPLTSDKI